MQSHNESVIFPSLTSSLGIAIPGLSSIWGQYTLEKQVVAACTSRKIGTILR